MDKKHAVSIVCGQLISAIALTAYEADAEDVNTLSAVVRLSYDNKRYNGYYLSKIEELLIKAEDSSAVPLLDEISRIRSTREDVYELR